MRASRFGARKARRCSKMATNRKATRQRIHQRIRKKVSGTAERPRLAVHFSARHVYAQVIDDDAGKTLAAVSTLQKDLAGKKAAANRESADRVVETGVACIGARLIELEREGHSRRTADLEGHRSPSV